MATRFRQHYHTKPLIPFFEAPTALAPTAVIYNVTTGTYWNHAGTAWGGIVINPMVEYDAPNQPGAYALGAAPITGTGIIPAANLTIDDQITIYYVDLVTPTTDHEQIDIIGDYMQQPTIRWHDRSKPLVFMATEIAGTTPITGSTHEILIRQPTGPNFHWGGAAWQVAAAWTAMNETDAVGSPGVYNYNVPAVNLAAATIGDVLYVSYRNTAAGENYYRNELVMLYPNHWAELVAAHVDPAAMTFAAGNAGTFGEQAAMQTALVHQNVRFDNHVYNADGQLTTVDLELYDTPNNAAAAAAGGLMYTTTFTVTYTNNRPSLVVSI
jgi:hypothetical protein